MGTSTVNEKEIFDKQVSLRDAAAQMLKWLDSHEVRDTFKQMGSLSLSHPHLAMKISDEFSRWAADTIANFRAAVKQDSSARVPSSEEPDPHSFTLLRLDGAERPLFFVLEERYGDPKEEGYQEQREYFYEEHSCPTNWLRDCVAIIEAGDDDPHGFLTFVRSVPIPETWNDLPVNKDWKSIFPEACDVTSYVNSPSKNGKN